MKIFVHFDEGAPSATLKKEYNDESGIIADIIKDFVRAYNARYVGKNTISVDKVHCVTETGRKYRDKDAIANVLKEGDDVYISYKHVGYVNAKEKPMKKKVVVAAGGASAGEKKKEEAVAAPIAKNEEDSEGSKLKSSIAEAGELSYYYAHNRSVGEDEKAPKEPPQVLARRKLEEDESLIEKTISSFILDDGKKYVKAHITLEGVGSLPEGAITCEFGERNFDLKVRQGKYINRLNVSKLLEFIVPDESKLKVKEDKVVVWLRKAKEDFTWYELRKTKGIGEEE